MNYWQNWERNRITVQEKYQKKIKKVLLHEIAKLSEMLKMYGYDYVLRSASMEALNPELTQIYIDMYKETAVKFGNMVYRMLRIEAKKAGNFGFNEVWAREAARFLSLEGIPMISTVTGNMRDELLKVIGKAIEDGLMLQLTLREMQDLILDRLREYGEVRGDYWAERIARTETVRGANYGALQGARSHNFKTVKVWISANDDRIRRSPFSHLVLNRQTAELDKPFNNGEDIMFPGDPKASPENTINCRCAIGFEPVRINGKLVPK